MSALPFFTNAAAVPGVAGQDVWILDEICSDFVTGFQGPLAGWPSLSLRAIGRRITVFPVAPGGSGGGKWARALEWRAAASPSSLFLALCVTARTDEIYMFMLESPRRSAAYLRAFVSRPVL